MSYEHCPVAAMRGQAAALKPPLGCAASKAVRP